ncbi:transketolase, partial [Candidatus Saccharibacteria bacterium]|nr:transketolase [Candidatus Saccharibacteria bacterium]
ADKFKSFNWEVKEIDGHNMKEILAAFEWAKSVKGKPSAIIAHTTKGKGVDFMENVAGWHGKPPNVEQMWEGLKQLKLDKRVPVEALFERANKYQEEATAKLHSKVPKFSRDYFWNSGDRMKVDMA